MSVVATKVYDAANRLMDNDRRKAGPAHAGHAFAFVAWIAFIVPYAEAQTSTYSAEPCRLLKDMVNDNWSVLVSQPGNYCFAQDLHQSWPLFRLPHQPVPMGPLLNINSNNVIIDLKNHKLTARGPEDRGEGVWHGSTYSRPSPRITIKNGFIATSTLPTVFLTYRWNNENHRFGDRQYKIALSNGDLSQYRPTEFILENLTLEADNHVIVMQGMNNIIRNCKIVGGNGTVNIYGPNLIFENNEIILKAKDTAAANGEAPVALYLEDSADSVVRNNHITVKGNAANVSAVALKNSPNVILTGNTVSGTKDLYKLLDADSTVKASENKLN